MHPDASRYVLTHCLEDAFLVLKMYLYVEDAARYLRTPCVAKNVDDDDNDDDNDDDDEP